jgi:carbon-monoxide dehydrogenase large subunit
MKIGTSARRVEDQRLLSGRGRYLDDIAPEGFLHGWVVRSQHAHARLLGVTVADALQMPGVVAVLTAVDYRAAGLAPMRHLLKDPHNHPDGASFFPARLPLAENRLRFVGEPVAFIVAATRDQARDAAEAVGIDVEPLDPVVSVEDAGAAVWDERPDNVCFVHRTGPTEAVEAAFGTARHRVSARFVIPRLAPSPLEPRGCLAIPDRQRGTIAIISGTQDVYGFRNEMARIFGEPEARFRVRSPDVGGSFGMKGIDPESVLTVWAARRIGRPVKWISDRIEAFLSDHHGRDLVSEAELALAEDGTFLALRVRSRANLGAFPSPLAAGSPINNLGSLAGVYRLPAISAEVTGVFTNQSPTGPYRGAGRPEASFIIERLVEMAARRLGASSAALRQKNLIRPDQMPFRTGLTYTYDCGDFPGILDRAVALAGVAAFPERRRASLKRGLLRGLGLAFVIERATLASTFEAVEIRVDPSGSVSLLSGSTDQGQGHQTMYVQLVCDRLGIAPERVWIGEGDTLSLASGGMTGSSRVSAMGSAAALQAIDRMIEKARAIAAHVLQVPVGEVEFSSGLFRVRDRNQTLDLAAVATVAHSPALLPPEIEPGLSATGIHRAAAENFPNGCHVCELEIDPETGAVGLRRHVVVDDMGNLINPMIVKGQLHGGIAQGVGEALMERMHYDAGSGQLLTATFMDYAMPRATDFPAFEIEDRPVPTATNPLGVKGAGEGGLVGAFPAVINAVVDALGPLGVHDIAVPATSERIWQAIRAAPVPFSGLVAAEGG